MTRIYLTLALAMSVSGCWSVSFVGPQVGATVTVHSTDVRRQPAGAVSVDISMHESQVVSFFSLETWWDTWPDSHKLLWMGAVDFSGDFEDDQVYLVYAEGGIDIDPESRGEIATEGTEYEPLTISGKNVVYAYGEHLKQNIYGVNPIAGAASFYIAIVAQSDDALMDDANLRARLDEAARLLTEDIDNNGLVTWEDLLAFDMRHNMNKFLGSPALLDAFIAASNTEVWTADTYQAAENLVEDAWRAARN